MSDAGANSWLAAIPDLLRQSGVNVDQLGAAAGGIVEELKDLYAEFPESVAFGPKNHSDQLAVACYEYVEPIKDFVYGVVAAFKESLQALGGDVGKVGGVLSNADINATAAAQSVPSGGHHH